MTAQGEDWNRAGRDINRLYSIRVGTDKGTAFILNGEVYCRLNGAHPDVGHQNVDLAGPQCYCCARGCWESLAFGSAIICFTQEQILDNPSLLVSCLSGVMSAG